MNEIQKKLDELTILRDKLVNCELNKIQSIDGTSAYPGKVRTIVKNYRKQIKQTVLESNNTMVNNQRQIKESQRQIKESQRQINLSINQTKNIISSINTTHADAIGILINDINLTIAELTNELRTGLTKNSLQELCKDPGYCQQFINSFLEVTHRTYIDKEVALKCQILIKNLGGWQYPGLQINAISKEWIDCMVGSDPLYIIHNKTSNSMSMINEYTPEYQRRLRYYNIVDNNFSKLPQNQFGCIACCYVLNTINFDNINEYLNNFKNLLRSGGSLVTTLQFNYFPSPLVEIEFFKFTIMQIVTALFESNGFDNISITIEGGDYNCTSIITAHKPGILTTTKAHQVLGSIIEK